MNTRPQERCNRAGEPKKSIYSNVMFLIEGRHLKIRLTKQILFALGLTCTIVLFPAATEAQTIIESSPSVRATHLLGLPGAKQNANGILSIQGEMLQFVPNGKPPVVVPMVSIRDIVVGGQSRQVGGLPMTLGKAAVPFGGGRVVSLFSHKKYDTFTVKYVDHEGGVHGAIFQLGRGQAENLHRRVIAQGEHVSHQTAEPGKEDMGDMKNEKQ